MPRKQSSTDIESQDVWAVVESWAFGLHRVDRGRDDTYQEVYATTFPASEMAYPDPLRVEWYTTVDVRTGEARDKGSNSMKLRFVNAAAETSAAPTQRLYRTAHWAQNVRERILSFLQWTTSPSQCPDCGNLLLWKPSQNGRFWGCTGYSQHGCGYTAPTAAHGPDF